MYKSTDLVSNLMNATLNGNLRWVRSPSRFVLLTEKYRFSLPLERGEEFIYVMDMSTNEEVNLVDPKINDLWSIIDRSIKDSADSRKEELLTNANREVIQQGFTLDEPKFIGS